MAAQTPIVSTTIGAEGLPVVHGSNLYLADTPEAFAENCVELLDSEARRKQMAENAFAMVSSQFSWEHAAQVFEAILQQEAPKPRL
jgi:glycosyltransferase involved in cell wall biosynthesis